MEKTGNNEQVKGNSCGPDVCRCQCLIGGACNRPVCTGAYKLERVCPEDGGVCDFCDGVLEEQCEDAREPLPPCPFCGSHDVDVENPDPHAADWWVRCDTCGAATDIFRTEDEAEAAWRRREMKPEQKEESPLKRAAVLSMELCDLLDALPQDQFLKAMNVLKARLQLSSLKASTQLVTGKAVDHG